MWKAVEKRSDDEEGSVLRVVFPHGERPTWYPLVILPDQETIDMREVEAILRHFCNAQINLTPTKAVKRSKVALKRK